MRYVCAAWRMTSRTSASDRANTLSRIAWFSGDRRSSLSRRITGRSVNPLKSSVNSAKPVARSATKSLLSESRSGFSVTDKASASVTAPRKPCDRELVSAADLLAQTQCAEQRQYPKQHGGAGDKRRRNSDEQQTEIARLHSVEQFWHAG